MLDAPTIVPAARFAARVDGEGALAFLDDVTTQDVRSLEPGQAAEACYLDERGRVLAPIVVFVTPDGSVLIDSEDAARAAVLERMARIAPLAGCTISDGPALTSVRGGVFSSSGNAIPITGALPGFDLVGAAPDLPRLSAGEWNVARIAAGIPVFGVDVEPGALVNETPYLARAVSFTKGCYPGQESVARVANLGRIRTRLVSLDLDSLVEPGTAFEEGTVTSAAMLDGRCTAIATARADLEPGSRIDVAGVAGTVRAIL